LIANKPSIDLAGARRQRPRSLRDPTTRTRLWLHTV